MKKLKLKKIVSNTILLKCTCEFIHHNNFKHLREKHTNETKTIYVHIYKYHTVLIQNRIFLPKKNLNYILLLGN